MVVGGGKKRMLRTQLKLNVPGVFLLKTASVWKSGEGSQHRIAHSFIHSFMHVAMGKYIFPVLPFFTVKHMIWGKSVCRYLIFFCTLPSFDSRNFSSVSAFHLSLCDFPYATDTLNRGLFTCRTGLITVPAPSLYQSLVESDKGSEVNPWAP